MGKFDSALLVAIGVAAISGAAGGCLVISANVLRGRNVNALLWVAYMIVGAVLAVAAFAFRYITSDAAFVGPEIILYCIATGAIGAITLGATNLSVRFILRRLGIEVEVKVRGPGEDAKNNSHET